jgi:murein DD-endopeptidase MepM/ murein hydrolase activator NlpD
MHWPTDHNDSGNVISPFGERTWNGRPQFHTGVDFGAETGDRFLAPEAATIIDHYFEDILGWVTKFLSLDGSRMWESHGGSESIPVGISGQINAGDQFDTSGNSENAAWSSGPHLHLGVMDTSTGQYIDPLPLINSTQGDDEMTEEQWVFIRDTMRHIEGIIYALNTEYLIPRTDKLQKAIEAIPVSTNTEVLAILKTISGQLAELTNKPPIVVPAPVNPPDPTPIPTTTPASTSQGFWAWFKQIFKVG